MKQFVVTFFLVQKQLYALLNKNNQRKIAIWQIASNVCSQLKLQFMSRTLLLTFGNVTFHLRKKNLSFFQNEKVREEILQDSTLQSVFSCINSRGSSFWTLICGLSTEQSHESMLDYKHFKYMYLFFNFIHTRFQNKEKIWLL